MKNLVYASEQISLFCRLNLNGKKDWPIRSSEMGMLIYLSTAEGDKTPMDVARFFNVTKAMATNMVTSMIQQGYLEKKPDLKDGRKALLFPTEKGRNLVDAAFGEYLKMMDKLKAEMGEADFNQFVKLLEMANDILMEEKIIMGEGACRLQIVCEGNCKRLRKILKTQTLLCGTMELNRSVILLEEYLFKRISKGKRTLNHPSHFLILP